MPSFRYVSILVLYAPSIVQQPRFLGNRRLPGADPRFPTTKIPHVGVHPNTVVLRWDPNRYPARVRYHGLAHSTP